MEQDNEKIVREYYDNWAENKRLIRGLSHSVEFHLTMDYILKYLRPDDKVLEIGCGTGIYTLEIARAGHPVTAIDISDKNLNILNEQITGAMKIDTINCNATNLSQIDDKTFDVSLMLGPLYHLFSKNDIDKSIDEVKRVTKSNGLIFFAFLSQDYIMMRNCIEIFENKSRYLTDLYSFVSNIDEAFYYFKIDDFEKLMMEHSLERLHLLTTDGISKFIEKDIDVLSDVGYQNYLSYLKSNCERKELMGFSPHLLYVAKKT